MLGEAPDAHWDARRFAGVPPPGPDRPILTGDIRLSPSQGDSYSTCPRRYALEQRLRLASRDTPYLHLGSLIHRALELAEKEIIGSGRDHAEGDRAIEILESVWEDANFGTPALTSAWLVVAREAVSKLYERWPGSGEPVQIEMVVSADIDGLAWAGKVDRVERTAEGLRVVDYKTGTSTQTYDEAAQSIQLGFYVIAVGEMLGEPVHAAEFWYPRSSAQSVSTRPFDIDQLGQVRNALVEVGRGILEENWEPRLNAHCDRCPFNLSCPAWSGDSGAYVP
jgi:RecB family exonuclease